MTIKDMTISIPEALKFKNEEQIKAHPFYRKALHILYTFRKERKGNYKDYEVLREALNYTDKSEDLFEVARVNAAVGVGSVFFKEIQEDFNKLNSGISSLILLETEGITPFGILEFFDSAIERSMAFEAAFGEPKTRDLEFYFEFLSALKDQESSFVLLRFVFTTIKNITIQRAAVNFIESLNTVTPVDPSKLSPDMIEELQDLPAIYDFSILLIYNSIMAALPETYHIAYFFRLLSSISNNYHIVFGVLKVHSTLKAEPESLEALMNKMDLNTRRRSSVFFTVPIDNSRDLLQIDNIDVEQTTSSLENELNLYQSLHGRVNALNFWKDNVVEGTNWLKAMLLLSAIF